MKKAIQTIHQLNAPVEKIWDLVKTGKSWENWLPILSASKVEGNLRHCQLDNGDVMEEQFLASNIEKTFIYTIHQQSTFPAENIVGIIRLEPINETQTKLYWSVEMEVENEATFSMLKENIEGVYTASAQQLQALAA